LQVKVEEQSNLHTN